MLRSRFCAPHVGFLTKGAAQIEPTPGSSSDVVVFPFVDYRFDCCDLP
jgi:hypothetical protein